MLSRMMPLVEESLRAPTPEAASETFFKMAEREGATYLQTRLYHRPTPLSSDSHWAAGGFITRIAPADWPGSVAFNYICFDCNPLLGAIRESRVRYRFSDFAPKARAEFQSYWEALSEADIAEALCATSYGPDGRIASLHLGFASAELGEETALTLQMAGLILTERLMTLAAPPPAVDVSGGVALTPRERDSLALVAEGKTDWEISVILGVSEATARFHVDNARRKLGAVNRAHAVAKMARHGLLN